MSGTPSEHSFVRTSSENIHLLSPLYKEAFGRDEPAEYFIKKYTTRWTKNGEFCGYMALNTKGECVAHHTAIPFLFRFGDQDVLAAHSWLGAKGFLPSWAR
jgi:hypothetical protein